MFRESLINGFRGKRILVVGDFMLDEYVFGRVERISPEAPVPVVEASDVTFQPGGAANVVANLVSLGAEVLPVGVVGDDPAGEKLIHKLKELGVAVDYLFCDSSRPTTRKTRIVAASQQLLRVDWESRDFIPDSVEKKVLGFLSDNASSFDAVIISDYGKGVVTEKLFSITGRLKEITPVFLDPKERNFPIYRNLTAMTPNVKETFHAVGIKPLKDKEAEEAGKRLIEKFNLDYAVVTRSERGLSVVTPKETRHVPTRAKQVYDVTGAGDTVISVFALSVAAGADPFEAGEIANIAAGIVVGKLGTATVTVEELREAVKDVMQDM